MKRPIIFILLIFFLLSAGTLCVRDENPTDLGVYKSTDYGEKYERKNSLPDEGSIEDVSIMHITVDDFNPKIIFLGTRNFGILKSTNAGELWERTGQETGIFYDIAIDPKNNRTVYAAGIVDDFGKVMKSNDGGQEWREVYRETYSGDKVFGVEIDHYDTRKIYAATEKGAIIKSEDNGRSWVVKNWFDRALWFVRISPFDSRAIFVGGPDVGLSRSADAGDSWEEIKMIKQPDVEPVDLEDEGEEAKGDEQPQEPTEDEPKEV